MRVILFISFFVTSLFAIIDIATVDFLDKAEGFSGAVYGSFQKKRGNTDKDEANYGGRLQYDTNKTITWLQGEAEKDKARSYVTDDNAFIHLRHIHQIYDPAWAMESYGQLKKDKFKNIEKRALFGAGLRYRIMNSQTYGKMFMGASFLDERIDYTNGEPDPDEHNTRFSSYFSYKLPVNKVFDFSYLGYYQPKLNQSSDYIIASLAEMTVHLTKVVDLSYLIEVDHDSQPALNVRTTDTQQRLSFIYRFGQDDSLIDYAQSILRSEEDLDDANVSDIVAVELKENSELPKDPNQDFVGKWHFKKESFHILLDGKGRYMSEDGLYEEALSWKLVSTQTQEGIEGARNQGTKLIIIKFLDEEGRSGRVENYLWNHDVLLGLSDTCIRKFRR